jgi:hypothetical protein
MELLCVLFLCVYVCVCKEKFLCCKTKAYSMIYLYNECKILYRSKEAMLYYALEAVMYYTLKPVDMVSHLTATVVPRTEAGSHIGDVLLLASLRE